MTWFKKHLNWAYVIVWGFAFVFSVAIILSLEQDLTIPDAIWILRLIFIGVLIIFVIMFPMSLLILRAKYRSMWWVLLGEILSPLWLTNKRKG